MSADIVIKQIESLPPAERQRVREFVLHELAAQADSMTQPERRPDLHPDSMEMALDFDSPLSDSYWIGKE